MKMYTAAQRRSESGWNVMALHRYTRMITLYPNDNAFLFFRVNGNTALKKLR
jgi:hypothetical protein